MAISNSGGCIYVATNPSFSEHVKIGYAQDLAVKINQLNQNEFLPFPFVVLTAYYTDAITSDQEVYQLIDSLRPQTHTASRENESMRKKGFYAMTPSEAVNLFMCIANLTGTTDKLQNISFSTNTQNSVYQSANTPAAVSTVTPSGSSSTRAPNFKFNDYGIPIGSELVFVLNPQIKVIVVDNSHVSYMGQRKLLSTCARELSGSGKSVKGTSFFSYNGETLRARRERMDREKEIGLINMPSVPKDQDRREQFANHPAPPFRFSEYGIMPGSILKFIPNPAIEATVVDDAHVFYCGHTLKLSPLAQRLRGTRVNTQGTKYFSYNGERLTDLRARIDAERASLAEEDERPSQKLKRLMEPNSKCVDNAEDLARGIIVAQIMKNPSSPNEKGLVDQHNPYNQKENTSSSLGKIENLSVFDQVTHKKFGRGVIENIDKENHKISVKFPREGIRVFLYPDVFENNLLEIGWKFT